MRRTCTRAFSDQFLTYNALRADTDAPVLAQGYPTVANVEDTEFDVVIQLNEGCTVYYVVVNDGSPAPTSEDIKAGTYRDGTSGLTSGSFSVPGTSVTSSTVVGSFRGSTRYDVWVVCEDNSPATNLQSVGVRLDITTASDNTPPVFSVAEVSSVEDTSAQFTVVPNENARIYYAVTASAATSPTIALLLLGLDGDRIAVVAFGWFTAYEGGPTTRTLSSRLAANVQYSLYYIGRVRWGAS